MTQNMTLNEYQQAALRTAKPEKGVRHLLDIGAYNLWEAGEVGNLVKKVLHHGHDLDAVNKKDEHGHSNRECIVDEAGDVLWALAVVLAGAGATLEDAASRNVEKLRKRYPEGFSEERSRNRTA